jgi:AraC-like DNA-binding protein
VARRAPLAELKGTDALAEIMSALQMQGRVFCRLELSGEWAFRMPGDGLARFHVIERGTCWVGTPDGGTQQLAAGDLLVAFGEHFLSDRDRPKTIAPVQQFLGPAGPRACPVICTLGPSPEVHMLCGVFTFARGGNHPLLRSLPQVLHVRGDAGHSPEWLDLTLRFLSAEVRAPGIGSEAVLSRLIDLIFVQAVRAWIAAQPHSHTGWVGALRDRQIAGVLGLMHKQPERPWTVATLAREVGMSRSTLARRFREILRETPLVYLSRSRLQAAAELMRTENLSLSEVAARVGYQSEASFSRAFRQNMGRPPAAYRRAARARRSTPACKMPTNSAAPQTQTECT